MVLTRSQIKKLAIANQKDFINMLNDYCLVQVFTRLPIFDRLQLDQVCPRWQSVNALKWSDIKEFDCGHKDIFLLLSSDDKSKLKKTMIRCRAYINQLTLCKLCVACIMPITLQKFNALRELTINEHKFDNAQMHKLSRIKGLVHLDLAKCDLNQRAGTHFSNLVNLETLNLDEASGVDDDVIVSIANHCKRLNVLNISYCYASENALCELAKLPSLTDLLMRGIDNVTDAMLASIAGMQKLERLVCGYCFNVSDVGILNVIRKCSNLFVLDIEGIDEANGDNAILNVCKEKQALFVLFTSTGLFITHEGKSSFINKIL